MIVGGLGSTVWVEAKESPEERSLEGRSAERSAERSYSERSLSRWRSTGSGTACSTMGTLGHVTADVVEDLGQCTQVG